MRERERERYCQRVHIHQEDYIPKVKTEYYHYQQSEKKNPSRIVPSLQIIKKNWVGPDFEF